MNISGCEMLSQVFQIFGKYTDTGFPTHCEHDIMYVNVNPENVSESDIKILEELGFIPDREGYDMFCSYRFGSC